MRYGRWRAEWCNAGGPAAIASGTRPVVGMFLHMQGMSEAHAVNTLMLKQLRQESSDKLMMVWDDGHTGFVTREHLRDRCPCASCSGEKVLLAEYVPPPPDRSAPGRYALKGVAPVGNYAITISWGDGHNLGIYTWDLLRSLCECDECSAGRSGWGSRGASSG